MSQQIASYINETTQGAVINGGPAHVGRQVAIVESLVRANQGMPFGIPAGTYKVQDLVYDYILKCWWNDAFGEKYSAVVNFDWYHPTYAYRYSIDQIAVWFEGNGIDVTATATTKAQHYVEGRSADPARNALGPSLGVTE